MHSVLYGARSIFPRISVKGATGPAPPADYVSVPAASFVRSSSKQLPTHIKPNLLTRDFGTWKNLVGSVCFTRDPASNPCCAMAVERMRIACGAAPSSAALPRDRYTGFYAIRAEVFSSSCKKEGPDHEILARLRTAGMRNSPRVAPSLTALEVAQYKMRDFTWREPRRCQGNKSTAYLGFRKPGRAPGFEAHAVGS